ncbi:MAG: hypothetical protein HZB39_07825 [Planctomycetes bacterium]|nr:hypothetical protein [Planctomycetota bacterium]
MRKAFAAIVMVVIALIWWSGREEPSTPESQGAVSTAAPDRIVPVPRTTAANAVDRLSIDVAPCLLVMDADGVALAKAELRACAVSDDGTLGESSELLEVSGDDGRLRSIRLRGKGEVFLVRRAGFVPAVVLGEVDDEREVRLETAVELIVTVVTDRGVPLEGALVVVAPSPPPSFRDVPPHADGAPGHPRPIWSRTTDGGGTASVAALRPGRYTVRVHHPLFCPVQRLEDMAAIDVRDTTRATVTMQDMFGVAFVVPSKSAVQSAAWDWDFMSVDHSPGVVSRVVDCGAALRERLPEAHVFVHRPQNVGEDEDQLVIGLRVALDDGTFWRGTAPMRPLRELREPCFLEQVVDARYRLLRLELRSMSGRLLELPLLFAAATNRGPGGIRTIEPGRAVFLEHGAYVVEPANQAAFTSEACKDLGFTVSDTEPLGDVVSLRIDGEFVPIEIVPILPGPRALSPVHVYIDDPAEQGVAVANWRPERGTIRMLVPAGPITIKTFSQHYENLVLTIQVSAEDHGRRIEVALAERR